MITIIIIALILATIVQRTLGYIFNPIKYIVYTNTYSKAASTGGVDITLSVFPCVRLLHCKRVSQLI